MRNNLRTWPETKVLARPITPTESVSYLLNQHEIAWVVSIIAEYPVIYGGWLTYIGRCNMEYEGKLILNVIATKERSSKQR